MPRKSTYGRGKGKITLQAVVPEETEMQFRSAMALRGFGGNVSAAMIEAIERWIEDPSRPSALTDEAKKDAVPANPREQRYVSALLHALRTETDTHLLKGLTSILDYFMPISGEGKRPK